MIEKRRAPRRPTSIDIEYQVTEVEFGHSFRVDAKGTIQDVSEYGFGMITSHPLEKGQVIVIKNGKSPEIRDVGVAKWVEKQHDHFRAGFGYRYME